MRYKNIRKKKNLYLILKLSSRSQYFQNRCVWDFTKHIGIPKTIPSTWTNTFFVYLFVCLFSPWVNEHGNVKTQQIHPQSERFQCQDPRSYMLHTEQIRIIECSGCNVISKLLAYITSLITRTALSIMLVNQIWILYWVNLKKTPLQFLYGFRATIWKLIVENYIFCWGKSTQ